MGDEFDQMLADMAREDFVRHQAAWAALGKLLSETRGELGRALDAINNQDSIEARVRIDEALAYLANIYQWREAVE